MKELDILLTAYVDAYYAAASDAEKQAFHDLLTLSDAELVGYLLQNREPQAESAARVVDRILGRTSS